MFTPRTFKRFLVALVLTVGLTPLRANGAGSIFDDENWEDPKIESHQKPSQAPPPPPTPTEPPPPPPARTTPPPRTPPEAAKPKPTPTPVQPVEPAKPALPLAPELDPHDLIQQANEKIKALHLQTAKLPDDSTINLFHQKAVAHAVLGELPAARDAMQRVLGAPKTNRSVILNSARIDIAGKADAMRAATGLEKYFKTLKEPDEPALELWGLALATYARNRGRVPEAKEAAFVAAQTQLEKTRPGEHRWGNSWVSEAEYQQIQAQRTAAMNEINGIVTRLRQAQDRYKQLEYQANYNPKTGRKKRPDAYTLGLMDKVDVEIGKIKGELAEAQKKLPRPKWVFPLRMDQPDPVLAAK